MYLAVIFLLMCLFFIDYIFFDNKIYHARINCWLLVKSVLCISGGWFDGDISPYGMGMYFVNILFLCYILYFYLTKKAKTHYILPYIIWAIIGFICATTAKNIPFFYSRTGRGYLSFAIGVMLCEFTKYSKVDKKQKKFISFSLAMSLAILILCIFRFGIEPTLGNVWKCFAVIIAPSILFIFINTSFLSRMFNYLSARITLINNVGHYSSSLYFSASVSMVAIKIIAHFQGIKDFKSKNFFYQTMIFVFIFSLIWDVIFLKIQKQLKKCNKSGKGEKIT